MKNAFIMAMKKKSFGEKVENFLTDGNNTIETPLENVGRVLTGDEEAVNFFNSMEF